MLNKELRTVIHKIVWVILLLSGFNAGIADAEWAKVRQVIDGDTVILETNQHVRLIGVDTPEIKSQYNSRTEYFALQAKQFVEQMTEGRKVFLEDDDAQAPFDKYGRRLAYIYLEDQTLLNRALVEQGYAEAIRAFPYKFKEEFLELEKQAKREGSGMWGKGKK